MASNGSASPPDSAARPSPWADELELPEVGLVARIVRLNMFVNRLLDDISARAGVAPADYLVLGVIRRSPGGCTSPSRICELLGRSSGGMTLTLDRLEAAGWLRRAPDPDDRRRVIVSLTAAGRSLSTEVNAALHTWEKELALSPARRAAANRMVDELLGLFESACEDL